MSEPIFEKETQRLMQTAAMMNGIFEKLFEPTDRQRWLLAQTDVLERFKREDAEARREELIEDATDEVLRRHFDEGGNLMPEYEEGR